MEDETLKLQDLVPAEPFIQSPGWPWWAWVILAVLIIGLALLIRTLSRKQDATQGADPALIAEEAYQSALGKIEQARSNSAIQEVATSCSAAIRRYLATATGDPSLFETHEEFLARHEALTDYPIEVRNGVSVGFGRLARLKYGKSPSGVSDEVADESRQLLQQIHQHRPA
ncbi:hypothetical protein [Haloferula sp.]|uniref:hypothetical protein n=1 Tax=Haloferula sp. TaxID=2497595 RepID=UPI003C78AFE0